MTKPRRGRVMATFRRRGSDTKPIFPALLHLQQQQKFRWRMSMQVPTAGCCATNDFNQSNEPFLLPCTRPSRMQNRPCRCRAMETIVDASALQTALSCSCHLHHGNPASADACKHHTRYKHCCCVIPDSTEDNDISLSPLIPINTADTDIHASKPRC